jgi:hypothetical protein
MVTFYQFVRPAILKLAGLDPLPVVPRLPGALPRSR